MDTLFNRIDVANTHAAQVGSNLYDFFSQPFLLVCFGVFAVTTLVVVIGTLIIKNKRSKESESENA